MLQLCSEGVADLSYISESQYICSAVSGLNQSAGTSVEQRALSERSAAFDCPAVLDHLVNLYGNVTELMHL